MENQTKFPEDDARGMKMASESLVIWRTLGSVCVKEERYQGRWPMRARAYATNPTECCKLGPGSQRREVEAFVQFGKKDDRCACDKMCRIDTVEPRKATGGGKEITFRCGRCGRG